MNKYLKYFLVTATCFLSIEEALAVVNPITDFSDTARAGLTQQYLDCLTSEDKVTYATKINEAIDFALERLYCQCGAPSITGEQMIETGSSSTVQGMAELELKDTLEDEISALNKELEQLSGAVMGTPAGDAFAALKAKRDALRNGVQSWYDHGNLISRSQKVDCSQVRNEVMGANDGLSISSYNPVSGNTNTSTGFTVTDSSGKQTFITPTDIFVSDGQSLFDSAKALKDKCLIACKQKGGTDSDCNKMCGVSRCGCRDTDNNGTIEATCEAGQFGPECLGIGSCNINMCDDPALLKSLRSGTALNALVAKYYKTSTNTSNPNQNPGTGGSDDIQVSGVSTSRICTSDGCNITITSAVDNQFSPAYLKWDSSGQDATLLMGNDVLQIQGTLQSIQFKAGEPITIHLNTSVANELVLNGGANNSDRIECLSCNNGSTILKNRNSTGCDKTGETNPHAECRATYDCTGLVRYGCWNFNFCGVNQCNDYLPDKDGNKLQSADCKASNAGQKWKCASRQNCVASSDGTYTTQSECLSSIQCGGGGTETERNTYYCCGAGGTCSLCTEGSNLYVNEAQCNNSCSKTTCPAGQTKCGSNCCRNIDQACENYTTCRNVYTCEGICCPNGCIGDNDTGICGGTGVSCCATGCN